MKEERFPRPGKISLGDQPGEKEIFRAECSNWLAAGRAEISTDSPGYLTIHLAWDMHLSAKTLVDRCGERTGWLHRDSPEGLECGLGHKWGVCKMEPKSAIEAPWLMYTKRGAGPHPSSFVLWWAHCRSSCTSVSTQALLLPTHRGITEIWALLQGPLDFRSRAEIWAMSSGFVILVNVWCKYLCKLSACKTSVWVTVLL